MSTKVNKIKNTIRIKHLASRMNMHICGGREGASTEDLKLLLSLGRHRNIRVWKAVPHCLMWCLWRERNGHSFEDSKWTIVGLKLLFFRTLFDWVSARDSVSCVSLHQFLDSCSLRA